MARPEVRLAPPTGQGRETLDGRTSNPLIRCNHLKRPPGLSHEALESRDIAKRNARQYALRRSPLLNEYPQRTLKLPQLLQMPLER
jgi:hypothetical protein